jgi:hypothetical protein
MSAPVLSGYSTLPPTGKTTRWFQGNMAHWGYIWPQPSLFIPPSLCYNKHMRILGFILVFAFLISGYTAAAQAYGEICQCPKGMMMDDGMKDCPNHMKDMGGKCPHSPCSLSAASATLPAALVLLQPAAAEVFSSPHHIVLQDMLYPDIRPPNTLA